MQLQFLINNQYIRRMDKHRVVADSRNYLDAYFMFSSDWDFLGKTAIFSYEDNCYEVIIVNNQCKVPPEVIQAPEFSLSVFGGNQITTNIIQVNVAESGLNDTNQPLPATPNVYNQILELSETAYQQSNTALEYVKDMQERADNGEFDGKNGFTFTPNVDSQGNLSWTNDGDLENPQTVNIRGEKGDKGDKGDKGEKGERGEKGDDGLTPYIGENGNWWIGDVDTNYKATPDGAEVEAIKAVLQELQTQINALEEDTLSVDETNELINNIVNVKIDEHNVDKDAHFEVIKTVANTWITMDTQL